MRTARPWMWAVLSVVLAAGSSSRVVAAQSEADASPPVAVTATRDCVGVGDAQVEIDADGTEHLRFLVSSCTLTSDDKGLDAPYTLVTHTDCYPDGSCTVWGTIETEGPDGWRGSYRGWVDADGTSSTVAALEGVGSFSGLTFVNRGMGDLGLGSTAEVEGVIYVGAPPPWDEA
jgi:hypothetical protein